MTQDPEEAQSYADWFESPPMGPGAIPEPA